MLQHNYCEKFGFTEVKRRQRLALLQLEASDLSSAEYLQTAVVVPHTDEIVKQFYTQLGKDPDAMSKMRDKETRKRLAHTMGDYLNTLGINFNQEAYFDERLHIGVVHSWIGISPALYQCAYRLLQQIIIDHIADDEPRKDELTRFLIKITALDMSLAIEAYHDSQLSSIEKFVDVERDRAEGLLEKMRHDSLTQIYTRDSILEVLENDFRVYKESGVPFCVAMLDIDHFKATNDNFGHLVGDEVLKGVAKRIKSSLRHVDAVGRYGGEEFLAVFSRATLDEALTIAQRIRNNIASAPFNIEKETVPTTISIGIAQIGHGEDSIQLIRRADEALYQAKQNGRNRVEKSE